MKKKLSLKKALWLKKRREKDSGERIQRRAAKGAWQLRSLRRKNGKLHRG